MSPQRPHIDVAALLRFERKSIAAALNLLEDRRPARQAHALVLLDELTSSPTPAHIVGITGPPGVGKSSLIARLIEIAAREDRRLAVVAVDPSSKVSGGALLGDRGRMQVPPHAPVYIRSFAARDRLGGLSREAFAAVFLLRHLCDVVIVETVGVGQSETDIAHIADTVVLVVQPFSGDVLQFIKAGVMEIPDILAINKADDEALARKAMADVKAALSLERQAWSRPVLAVSAATNLHLDELDAAISAHHHHLLTNATLPTQRAEQTLAWATSEVLHEVGRRGLLTLGGPEGVKRYWDQQPAQWSALHRLDDLLRSLSWHQPRTE
ncbi:MAG: methylmalonyl Co-A mutase-associated GTPase MeaB [Deltaproteobacteria bacterium]|nr:methylmalonyl Co-A mutase-associated GTPase MeaB [Deltaproteobacteria bacterium]